MPRKKAATPNDRLMSATTISIDKIRVGSRHRKDLGDIAAFAANIAEIGGLLHPIVIRPDGTLIAGERRLAACKLLGWAEVPVTIVDMEQIARGGFSENAYRKDFLPSEIDAIRRHLEPIERAAAKERQRAHGGTAPGKHSGKISTSDAGKTRDKIGAFAGISGRQVEKIAAVTEAAEREPEKFDHLLAVLDRPGGVNKAYCALRRAQDEQRIVNLAPRQGRFHTLVLDPPWDFDDALMGRGAPYALMTRDELLALPVPHGPKTMRISTFGQRTRTCRSRSSVWPRGASHIGACSPGSSSRRDP
jgi:hypothetical protein